MNGNNIHVDIRYPHDLKTSKANDFSTLRYKENDLVNGIKVIVEDVNFLYSKALEILRS